MSFFLAAISAPQSKPENINGRILDYLWAMLLKYLKKIKKALLCPKQDHTGQQNIFKNPRKPLKNDVCVIISFGHPYIFELQSFPSFMQLVSSDFKIFLHQLLFFGR